MWPLRFVRGQPAASGPTDVIAAIQAHSTVAGIWVPRAGVVDLENEINGQDTYEDVSGAGAPALRAVIGSTGNISFDTSDVPAQGGFTACAVHNVADNTNNAALVSALAGYYGGGAIFKTPAANTNQGNFLRLAGTIAGLGGGVGGSGHHEFSFEGWSAPSPYSLAWRGQGGEARGADAFTLDTWYHLQFYVRGGTYRTKFSAIGGAWGAVNGYDAPSGTDGGITSVNTGLSVGGYLNSTGGSGFKMAMVYAFTNTTRADADMQGIHEDAGLA